MRKWGYLKGHGTLNDFVVIIDRHGMMNPSADDVRFLCDRRRGIGGDGLLRIVSAGRMPEWDGDPGVWFMDYRNADGSLAEMCGNGLRLAARVLVREDLVSGTEFDIGTRGGLRHATVRRDDLITVTMGAVEVGDHRVQVSVGEHTWPATNVDVGNPHAVVHLPEDVQLSSLDLTRQPTWEPAEAFPHGVNVEFVTSVGERHIAMRVHERGVGETMSCGTGTVAAAAAAAQRCGGLEGVWRVDVPGGSVEVDLSDPEQTLLTGPAVSVYRGTIRLDG